MKMEELSNNRYIKNTDTVERYLLQLVSDFFKNNSAAHVNSMEFIINKALKRMKEEISFENIGVTSITLPNGQVLTGAITLTLEQLNGEPSIQPKLTAFNVDFGNEANTACEGNDVRLSDKREPLEHEHEISDIIGLEGKLSTILGRIDRVNGLVHVHKNKDILDKLTYSGDKTSIDLTILDTLDESIFNEIEAIKELIKNYKDEIPSLVNDISNTINDIENEINNANNLILSTSEQYLSEAKQYTDTKFNEIQDNVFDKLDEYITGDMLEYSLKNAISLVGTINIPLNQIININSSVSVDGKHQIPNTIIEELDKRKQFINDCQIEFFIKDKSNGISHSLPYVIFNEEKIIGSISGGIISDNNIYIKYSKISDSTSPIELSNSDIIVKLYSKQDVTI